MGRPHITVIIPSFNRGPYLERAICSVLDQGYENLETIVVDGGSDDGSFEILQRYAHELTWWQTAVTDGPAAAIELALARATGGIVGVLDADAIYLPHALDAVAEQFERDTAAAWLAGHCLRIGQADEALGRLTAAVPDTLSGFLMHDSGFLPQVTTFYRRSTLTEHGGLSTSLRYAYLYDLHCRLLAAGESPAIVPTVLGAMRESRVGRSVESILREGMEYVDTAERYMHHLPLTARYALWRNCDERRRIYALAEAEAHASEARQYLWQRLLRRPWWLASEHYRQMLLQGPAHALPREAA